MSNRTTVTSWLIVSTLAIAFLAAGCASVRTVDLQADDPEARAQIERRLHEVFVAAECRDFDRLESYHLYGPKFTRFSGASVARQDAAAARKIEHRLRIVEADTVVRWPRASLRRFCEWASSHA